MTKSIIIQYVCVAIQSLAILCWNKGWGFITFDPPKKSYRIILSGNKLRKAQKRKRHEGKVEKNGEKTR